MDEVYKNMAPNQVKRIGMRALVALVLASLIVTTLLPASVARHGEDHPVAPGGLQSNNCSAEFTLSFGVTDSGDLDRTEDDTVDTWEVDVPDRSGNVQLDVTKTSGDDLKVALYNKINGNCQHIDTVNVGAGPEFDELADDQKYWPHVSLRETTDVQAEYDIIMEDD